ncbi:DUF3862 domain-containing protein [Schleiferilactobacillus perolens]|jgi:hypothetical protein|uniref:DUF3862 domain-containing protein n=1 Tax=Schleiferilactobacillus perolens TaxID=100468 RepID=UPI002353836A|nr:DUF3862 domain-containing protein [Schleiferilactobacillus perolens]MCI2172170.1 DUF3862 domain-containing protein [Schleiferilactobacillus perolens]
MMSKKSADKRPRHISSSALLKSIKVKKIHDLSWFVYLAASIGLAIAGWLFRIHDMSDPTVANGSRTEVRGKISRSSSASAKSETATSSSASSVTETVESSTSHNESTAVTSSVEISAAFNNYDRITLNPETAERRSGTTLDAAQSFFGKPASSTQSHDGGGDYRDLTWRITTPGGFAVVSVSFAGQHAYQKSISLFDSAVLANISKINEQSVWKLKDGDDRSQVMTALGLPNSVLDTLRDDATPQTFLNYNGVNLENGHDLTVTLLDNQISKMTTK